MKCLQIFRIFLEFTEDYGYFFDQQNFVFFKKFILRKLTMTYCME